jgi:hypothetical protein
MIRSGAIRKLAPLLLLALFVTTGAVVSAVPAHAQGIDLNIHWGSDTWGRYCRGDAYGHYWGQDRRYDRQCWENRRYDRDYHRDRWGRW